MSNFFIDLLYLIAAFAVCLATSFVFFSVVKPKKKQKKRKPSGEAVYYVSAQEPKPKPKTIAIKGTLLTDSQLDELINKRK